MTWIFALIGYARAYITSPSRGSAMRPKPCIRSHIFHQTSWSLGFVVIPWQVGIGLKMAAVADRPRSGEAGSCFEAVRRYGCSGRYSA